MPVVKALLSAFMLSACFSAHAMIELSARAGSRDVKLPTALVHRIETEYRAFLKKNSSEEKPEIKRHLLNMSVEFTQKRPVALHDDTKVATPLGGGVIDLSEIVTPLRGAFRMKILAKKEDGSQPVGLRMFFVSHAKTRVLDGDTYGAGCDKYMEISRYFQRGNGFELYSSDQRDVSVIGGTFVAVAFAPDALYVGSVTFNDSRYPQLMCE